MAKLGFAGGKLTFIAVLEIIGAAGFLMPRTRPIGLLWVSSYLGGAICAHVHAGEFDKAVSPAIIPTRLMGGDLAAASPNALEHDERAITRF
jgi:DoxX-like family